MVRYTDHIFLKSPGWVSNACLQPENAQTAADSNCPAFYSSPFNILALDRNSSTHPSATPSLSFLSSALQVAFTSGNTEQPQAAFDCKQAAAEFLFYDVTLSIGEQSERSAGNPSTPTRNRLAHMLILLVMSCWETVEPLSTNQHPHPKGLICSFLEGNACWLPGQSRAEDRTLER